MSYKHQTQPFVVSTDGKLIEEHLGLASITCNNVKEKK
jgi:hypothetical protein